MSLNMKKILVVDGNSIINRAFYGIRDLTTRSGKHTNAIYGMINIISRQLQAIKPDYAAVAFDLCAPTFRKQMYPAYKEGRHSTPEELLSQFDDAKECLRLMGLHTLELCGYEADDIQGTIASMTKNDPELFAYILSGDRDLLQLIDDRINVLLATNSDTVHYDTAAFTEKYGVPPVSLIDAKALMGDSSDNIPGVAGIGEKTAFKLITEFGSLDKIYENIDSPSIAKGVREKLINGKDSAYLCYTLAKIITDVPIINDLEDIKIKPVDNDGLYSKFKELEFNAFIKKFGLTEPSSSPTEAPAEPTVKTSSPECSECARKEAEEANACSAKAEICASYTEISSSELLTRDIPSFALQLCDGKIYVSENGCNYCVSDSLSSLSSLFENAKEIICYDSKALYHTLSANGIKLNCIPKDIMLYSYVINSADAGRSVHQLAEYYLSASLSENEPYAHLLSPLCDSLAEKAAKEGSLELIEKVELPLAILLAEIEETGFKIDVDGMKAFCDELTKTVDEDTERIYQLAGLEFNINSPKQLAQVLVEELGLPLKKKTKSGYSTDVETLEKLRFSHPIIDEILDYRKVQKLKSTYAVGLLKVADENGRVHTDFKQALTATGRLSSSEPNLQNIPIKTALGRKIREQFTTKNEDYVLIDADYSQIELRLLACLSGDETMTEAFNEGADIHTKTASAVFGIPEYAVTEEYRKRAKAVNFGIVYGIGAYSLSGDLNISVGQAKQYIDSYFEKYTGIKDYLDSSIAAASELGYTTTLFGRRRYIPELSSSKKMMQEFGKRVAMNSPIQGTAADIMKIAMLNVDRRLKAEGLDAKIVMQVHDELVIEAHKDCAELAADLLKAEMENAVLLPVPLTVDVSVCRRWSEE
ncbi:MAG: DNA polymerase I [Ruminococcaceae bacterium]|nr:DNA polymerase I [Oscillospiraceae bacterium]